ncbi:MAG: glycosyltransferase family 2 protein [Bacteroidota bacterium]
MVHHSSFIIPIIILNWNGLADTLECLQSLQQQTHQNFHVYLVDNASEGDDLAILKKQYGQHPKVTIIANDQNLGFTKGNNEVLRQYVLPNPDYQYVILLNNDTAQDPNWINELFKAAIDQQAHIVSSKMVNYFDRSKMDNAGHQMLNTGEIIPIGHNEPVEQHNEPNENMGACAGAALYDVDMLRKIGILDEFFTTGYEDAEIGVRANVLGYKTVYAPEAIVYHKVSQSVAKIWNYEYVLQIQVNIYYSYLKLLPLPLLLFNVPFLLFKFVVLFFINLLFWRPKFLKILFHSYYRIFTTHWPKIRRERQRFFQEQSPNSSWQIAQKMRFFLWFDIGRFWKYFVLKREMIFEKW